MLSGWEVDLWIDGMKIQLHGSDSRISAKMSRYKRMSSWTEGFRVGRGVVLCRSGVIMVGLLTKSNEN